MLRAPIVLPRLARRWSGLAALLVVWACKPEIVPEPYVPTDAHDAYVHGLRESGLAATALGRDFLDAAERALRSPMDVQAPFEESFYVDATKAFSAGYRFAVRRGQRTEIQLELEPPSDTRLYVDLFREPEAAGDGESGDAEAIHVASAGAGDQRLAFEPRRDGVYLLRVQPELLRGGRCLVSIRNVPALEFPVEGSDSSAIGSRFGAPREGGRRQHHGVDIFAPRNTIVRATSRARVRLVDEWKLGGRIVWLEDRERNLRLYFAHLETQDVEPGTWVEPGDPIGTVGNSGNARTTPTHLHFGVYARGEGPIDPLPFLLRPKGRAEPIEIDLELLGQRVRTRRSGVVLTDSPQRPATGDDPRLPADLPLEVLAGHGRSLRVELPDGRTGYVPAGEVEAVTEALDSITIAATREMVDRPGAEGVLLRSVAVGERLDVLARFDEFLLVEAPGASGWIRDGSAPGRGAGAGESGPSPIEVGETTAATSTP